MSEVVLRLLALLAWYAVVLLAGLAVGYWLTDWGRTMGESYPQMVSHFFYWLSHGCRYRDEP